MLYHLFSWIFEGQPYFYRSALFRAVMATLTASGIMFVIAPKVIRQLIKLKIGDLPEFDHQSLNELTKGKTNTPTMGGVMIVFAIGLAALLWADLTNFYLRLGIVVMLWLAALGAFDDYLKLTKKTRGGSRDGLKSWEKLLFQAAISVIVAAFLVRNATVDWATGYNLIFYKNPVQVADLLAGVTSAGVAELLSRLAFFLVTLLVITGASNAVNLTDGLDGLAAGCMGIVSFVFMVIAFLVGSGLLVPGGPDPTDKQDWSTYLGIPGIPYASELAILCGAMLGACLGFLWFNCNPAQVFMGDTGSLALGGLIGYVAIVTRYELLLFLVGGVFVMEAISVMLQVSYFKYTKRKFGEGRRLFTIAPIHHHFQLSGWTETQVVVRFWLIGILLAAASLATVKLR